MSEQNSNYWYEQQSKNADEYKKDIEFHKSQNIDLWKSLVMVHAIILGITVSLLSYYGDKNWSLVLAWILEISSIMLGLCLIGMYVEREKLISFSKFQFNWDINEINIMDSEGKIGKEEKAGMVIAAMRRSDSIAGFTLFNSNYFTEKAEELANAHGSKLPSSKLLKNFDQTKKYKIIKYLLKQLENLAIVLYILTGLSFLFLLLSVFLSRTNQPPGLLIF